MRGYDLLPDEPFATTAEAWRWLAKQFDEKSNFAAGEALCGDLGEPRIYSGLCGALYRLRDTLKITRDQHVAMRRDLSLFTNPNSMYWWGVFGEDAFEGRTWACLMLAAIAESDEQEVQAAA